MAYVSKHVFTEKQKRYLKIKRVLDILLALILLIPASIIMLVFAIWIRLESKGPAIFKQRRPGYHQNIFTLYKLRSMRIETRDKDGKALSDQERMTLSGKVARKTSVDELPQLLNILKGEMSFIGPRPFLINDLDSYNEEQLVRFEVLPGITSWTAIHGRNNQTLQEKYDQEIYYVNHISFAIDMKIFFKTIGLVLSQKDVEDHMTDGRIAAEIIEDDK
ncbi:MAG: sugar transferase [Lachnospiraceae bacterium]|nr:sugar transferase [Lachnospiraceae bacterium]